MTKYWAYHSNASGSYRNAQLIVNGTKMIHIQANMSVVQNLLYKAQKLSVCPSVCIHFWHTHNSAVFASIETGLARN